MEIRVKKACLFGYTKRELKRWGIKIRRDWDYMGVRILTLPPHITLVRSSIGFYFIRTQSGRNLGHIFSPFELDGGHLTFAP